MSVVCVFVHPSFSCIRCNRYTVARLKARSSDYLLFGFSVKPSRCSTASQLPSKNQRRLTLLDIVTSSPKVSRSVIGSVRPEWYSCVSGLRVYGRMVMWCEDFVKLRLSCSGKKLRLCEAARNINHSQSDCKSLTMTPWSAFTQIGCQQFANNYTKQQYPGKKITMF